jgi:decaprenylphospho-beta-D-ribofuranose 2-oxidase
MPGTGWATVGGAIASDVHGRNQPGAGTFGQHVRWLTLITSSGHTLELSQDRDPAGFWATVGGMGLTGLIDRVCLQLTRPASPWWSVSRTRTDSLDVHLERLDFLAREQRNDPTLHVVGWVDATSSQGRGVCEVARPLDPVDHDLDAPSPSRYARPPVRRRSLPGPGVVSRGSIRVASAARLRAAVRRPHQVVSARDALQPLDRMTMWPSAFGHQGLTQYQFCVPPEASDLLHEVLGLMSARRLPAALAVVKRFGSGDPSMMGFTREGWSLAVDLPTRWRPLGRTLDEIDAAVAEAGGRVYLTKDSRLSAATVSTMYPRLEEFKACRARLDRDHRMITAQGRRLGLVDSEPDRA